MNKGVFYAIGCYTLWGFFPIYFKWLHSVAALEIVAHRILWSLVFLLAALAIRKDYSRLKEKFNARTLAIYAAAGALLSINWLVYVWGVNSGYVVETSLGYYINPLVSVLLGVVFLHERLRTFQWLPVGIAAAGVIYLTVGYGSLPWIALMLALTFGTYGLIKKTAPLGAFFGLTFETSSVVLPALGYILFLQATGAGALGQINPLTTILLMLSGPVTMVPLLLFAKGAQLIPLSTLGLLQYISPTLQFLVGVLLYNEPFTPTRLVGFSMIWLALILFSTENLLFQRRASSALAA